MVGSRAQGSPSDALERMVHDLHGPLTVIRGMCASLMAAERSPDRRRALGMIDAEALRLAAGLRSLRSAGGAVSPSGRCDLAALAAAAVRRFDAVAGPRGGRVVSRGRRAPTFVAGDPARLERALDNLLWNAVRHGAPAGEIVVGLSARDGWAHLRVRDDGPGVAPEDRDRIFEAGQRGSAPRGAGRGLGLAIAREAAEEAGGRLLLDPVGPGACFRLVLPLARDAGTRGAA